MGLKLALTNAGHAGHKLPSVICLIKQSLEADICSVGQQIPHLLWTPKDSLPYSQQPTTGPCSKPYESSLHPFFKILITLYHLYQSCKVMFFLQIFQFYWGPGEKFRRVTISTPSLSCYASPLQHISLYFLSVIQLFCSPEFLIVITFAIMPSALGSHIQVMDIFHATANPIHFHITKL
jgi:hypothetical protein